MTIWLKPIGTQEHPVSEDSCKSFRYEAHFQKEKRPSGVKEGDILIIYAVHHKWLVGYGEVISRIFESSKEEQAEEPWRVRFPYGVYAENKSTAFSSNWFGHKLDLFALGKEYYEATEQPLTRPGAENLNAIEWGHSHIALAEGFARFLLKKMDDSIINK